MLCAYKICFIEKIFGYQVLYAYQKEKILSTQEIDTVFLGDSSLGNSINSEYFKTLSGLKSINLALTGMYGYAGSYNLLKAVTKKRKIKNVILMNTIDMMNRKTAYDGYIYTMETVDDLIELPFNKKMVVLRTLIQIFLSKDNISNFIEYYIMGNKHRNTIDNDYIKQNTSLKISHFKPIKITNNITADKLFFLKKIKDFCDDNTINLIYVHGPIYKTVGENSKSYINYINRMIIDENIRLKKNVLYISDMEVGDSIDHVKSFYKNQFTKQYFLLLQNDLTY